MSFVEHCTFYIIAYKYISPGILFSLHSPETFVSGVKVGATAAVEVALQFVPVGRRGGVLAVLDELVGHRRRGHRAAVRHGRAQLQRGENGSELYHR